MNLIARKEYLHFNAFENIPFQIQCLNLLASASAIKFRKLKIIRVAQTLLP